VDKLGEKWWKKLEASCGKWDVLKTWVGYSQSYQQRGVDEGERAWNVRIVGVEIHYWAWGGRAWGGGDGR